MKSTCCHYLAAALAGLMVLTGCKSLPNDGAHAQTKRFDHLNQVRYLEIFLVGGDFITGNLYGRCYNTTFAPSFDLATSRDSAPQAAVRPADPTAHMILTKRGTRSSG